MRTNKTNSQKNSTVQSAASTNTRIYCISNKNGIDIVVCKECFFCKLRALDERRARVLREKEQGSSPYIDKRGCKAPCNKTGNGKVTNMMNFIVRFPKYQSHYSRKKSQPFLLASYFKSINNL